MPIKPGVHLGGIRTLEDLRLRCVCREDEDDCWHLRSARGRPMPKDRVHCVAVHGQKGNTTATRAAWALAGKTLRDGQVVRRVCGSYDCVNPEHLCQGLRAEVSRKTAADGKFRSAEQLAPLAATRKRHTKVTPEALQLILTSPLPASQLVAHVPICVGRINALRRKHRARPTTVFAWGGAA